MFLILFFRHYSGQSKAKTSSLQKRLKRNLISYLPTIQEKAKTSSLQKRLKRNLISDLLTLSLVCWKTTFQFKQTQTALRAKNWQLKKFVRKMLLNYKRGSLKWDNTLFFSRPEWITQWREVKNGPLKILNRIKYFKLKIKTSSCQGRTSGTVTVTENNSNM